jgi:hypothetical protein
MIPVKNDSYRHAKDSEQKGSDITGTIIYRYNVGGFTDGHILL